MHFHFRYSEISLEYQLELRQSEVLLYKLNLEFSWMPILQNVCICMTNELV